MHVSFSSPTPPPPPPEEKRYNPQRPHRTHTFLPSLFFFCLLFFSVSFYSFFLFYYCVAYGSSSTSARTAGVQIRIHTQTAYQFLRHWPLRSLSQSPKGNSIWAGEVSISNPLPTPPPLSLSAVTRLTQL